MMNRGGAQISQAVHPQLLSVKRGSKAGGNQVLSLAGMLHALLPGVGKPARGFGITLQQLVSGKPGLGVQLTRKLAVGGHDPPRERNGPNLKVGTLHPQQTGKAKSPVLRSGKATREVDTPQSSGVGKEYLSHSPAEGVLSRASIMVEGLIPGSAPQMASKPPGSGADPAPKGHVSGQHSVQHVGLHAEGKAVPAHPAGDIPIISLDGGRKSSARGETPSRARSAVLAEIRAGEGAKTNGRHSRVRQMDTAEGTKHSSQVRSESLPSGKGIRVPSAGPDQRSIASPLQAGESNLRSGPHRSPQFTADGLRASHGQPSHQTVTPAGIGVRAAVAGTEKPHARAATGQPNGAELTPRGLAGKVAAVRHANQDGLESSHPLRRRQRTTTVQRSGSGRKSSKASGAERSTDPGISRIGAHNRGTHSPVFKGEVRGNGAQLVDNHTDPNGGRRFVADENSNRRGFVKPVAVGIHRQGKAEGIRSPAPIISSLPGSLPIPGELAAGLASVARMTVLQYSRFVDSEQPKTVFTFDGGSMGNVQLTFREGDLGTVLHIVVESSEVRQMLQRALPNLEQEWTQQGLDFSDVSVEVGDTGQERDFPGQKNIGGNPNLDIGVAEEVASDPIVASVKNLGYNTVEFVA